MNAVVDFPALTSSHKYSQLRLDFDPALKTLFSWMAPRPRACFSQALVSEIGKSESLLELHQGWISHNGTPQKVEYMVFGSEIPGVFNLGGDLDLFIGAITRRDRASLSKYAHDCVENIFRRHTGFGAGIGTFSLVQGKALGGGFECALASDVIVAEKSATLGFPEMLFNLFPGMGALTFLARRMGLRQAEEIITSPQEPFSARTLHDMGAIDFVVDDGDGLDAIRDLVRDRQRRQGAYRAWRLAKQEYQPVRLDELKRVTDVWVDAAMRLEARDLRMMSRLVRAQDRLAKAALEAAELGDDEQIPLAAVVNG